MNKFSKENVWEEKLHRTANPLLYPILKSWSKKPITRIPGLGVVISDPAMLREILNDKEHFTKTGKRGPANLWTPIVGDHALINMDGREHMELRRKMGPLFSPRSLSSITGDMMDLPLDNMVSDLLAGKDVDLVKVSIDMAGRMICKLTGLDANDSTIQEAVQRTKELTAAASLSGRMGNKSVEHGKAVLAQLTDPVKVAYETGGAETVPGRLREYGLTLDEVMGVCSAFLIAGTETISTFLPRIVSLMDDEYLRRYHRQPENREAFINEGLRVVVPSPVMMRNVSEEIMFHGHKLGKDSRVILSTVFACRKLPRGGAYMPDFAIPDVMRNIWFGAGSHFCIGMPLAMLQSRTFLDRLTSVYDGRGKISIVSREASSESFTATYKSFVVRWEAK